MEDLPLTDGDTELEKQGKRRGRGDGEKEKQGGGLVANYTKRDGERNKCDCEKKRVSFRKQTLRQPCMTCTFSPLSNPDRQRRIA